MRTAAALLCLAALAASCGPVDERPVLTLAASGVGAEGEVLRRQLARFEEQNPGVRVELRSTPDSADERHQLYVQWLNAGASEPDLLQLDVVWTPELAAAGFLLPLDEARVDAGAYFPSTLAANRFAGKLWALPWFVDVGMLYWRTDLLERPPATFEELAEAARARPSAVSTGFAWQGARYEGLVCVFLEVLGGMGGRILDERGRVVVDSEAGVRALAFLSEAVGSISPPTVVTWQEEQARFAFQNGEALFMRNWPYAAPLLSQAASSEVEGRFAVAPMPAAPGGAPTATLGGQALAINARTRLPEEARRLLAFLSSDEAMTERARVAGQYPPKPALYDSGALEGALPIPPARAKAVIERATPRPPSPVWTELSSSLQVHLHRALTGQAAPEEALAAAARDMRALLAERDLSPDDAQISAGPRPAAPVGLLVAALALVVALGAAWALRRRGAGIEAQDERFGWMLAVPALALMALVAVVPLGLTFLESFYDIDLRAPWRGAPFAGLGNYFDVLGSERFWAALGRTAAFAAVTVSLELALGLALALVLHQAFFGRGVVRGAVLVPWAIPAVVAAVIWRFLFDGPASPVNAALLRAGLVDEPAVWLAHPLLAWVPVVLADVWKTTPFVALLLLAGLQGIDDSVYEAARMDGAGPLRRLFSITLPLLKPALLVALVFRTLDAVRVFDLVYVLTGGGPGTATETVSLLTFDALMKKLRFGEGAALSVVVFALAFALAMAYVRLVGEDMDGRRG